MINKTLITLLLISISVLLSAQNFKEVKAWSFDIQFDFGKYELKEIYLPRLDTVVRGLLLDSSYVVLLEGHTDAVGSDIANQRLSYNRVMAIKTYLQNKNVDSTRISYQWLGENQPISENLTEEGRQANRRVSLTVIKRISLIDIHGTIEDDSGKVVPNATVIARSKFHIDSTTTDSSGQYTLRVPQKIDVALEVVAKNYFFEQTIININTSDIKVPRIKLLRALIGRKVKLNNLYFKANTPILLEDSYPDLKLLLKYMLLNDDHIIEIQGHINLPNSPPVNVKSWDYELSVDRAKAVYNFLIEKNIPQNRMTYKGYGNSEMVYPKAKTESYMRFNRRVEIKLIGKLQ